MTRPASKLRKILDQLEVELKKIKTDNGYFTQLLDNSIMRRPHVWATFNAFPCLYFYFSGSSQEKYPGKSIRKTDTIKIVVKFRETADNDIPIQVSEFLTDFEYLLSQNPHLTDEHGEDLVVLASIQRVDSDKGNLSPLNIVAIDLNVVYHEYY